MVVLFVLRTLWSILDRNGKSIFSSLVLLLIVTGIVEMGGMVAIFGFIRGLSVNAETGLRSGPVAGFVRKVIGGPPDQFHYVSIGGGAVLAFIVLKNVQSLLTHFAMNRFLMKRNLNLAQDLFEGYLNAPYEKLQPHDLNTGRKKIGEILEVFSGNFAALARILADGIMVSMVVALLLFVNPVLTCVVATIFGLAGSLIYWGMQRPLIEMGREELRAKTEANRYLNHAFKGIVETRLRDLRLQYVRHYTQAIRRTTMISRRRSALGKLPRSTNEILLVGMIVGAVLYLTLVGQSVEGALPTLALFGFAGLRMTGAISRLNSSLQKLRQGYERMADLTAVLETVVDTYHSRQDLPKIGKYLEDERPLPLGVTGRLTRLFEMKDVRFRFEGMDHDILAGVSLSFEPGSFVAFCGPSGGGKTTLVKVIMGLLVPQAGSVECDGWSIYRHIRAWHRNIGYVGQSLFITDEVVRSNVAFGVPDEKIDDARVERALKLASAWDFVLKLPYGLGTNLRGGDILSGGQRQRIVIARALYDDPDLIVFDEATAALDNETEREISDAIVRLSGAKTIICVAHRLSTIRAADTIHFVADGYIEASGSFDELLETCAPFRRMVEAGEIAEDTLPQEFVE